MKMNRKKNLDNIHVKLPLDAVAVIMNAVATDMTQFIRFDDSQFLQDATVGEGAAKLLLSGEAVRLYDSDSAPGDPNAKYWDVTLEMLQVGVIRYLRAGVWFLLDGDTLDSESLEPFDAIPILMLAIFGVGLDETLEVC